MWFFYSINIFILTFYIPFSLLLFFSLPSFSLRARLGVSGGYTIKYPIKFFCIFFYNLMRVFMCAHDFFSLREKKLFKKSENTWVELSKGTNTRAHIDMRALRVFHNNDDEKINKIERVKIFNLPAESVCAENPIFLFYFILNLSSFFIPHVIHTIIHHMIVWSKLSNIFECLALLFLMKFKEYSWNFLLITILRRLIR